MHHPAVVVRSLGLVTFAFAVAAAQTTDTPALAILQGQVRNASTGEPLAKATLLLTPASSSADSWSQSTGALSDSSGKFEIRNITPGKYRLRVSRKGFIPFEFGARGAGRPGIVIELTAANQHHQKIKDILLVPHAVAAGRVLDTDGEPMERAQIQLLRSRYANGKKVLSTTATTHTNDLGEYRFSGLTPGKYYLYAANMEGLPPSSAIAEEFVPVYYPDAADAAGAAPLDLAPGSQVQAADVILRKARTVTVKGRVTIELAGSTGVPVVRLGLNNAHDDSKAHSRRFLAAKINPSTGEFEIRGVTPGSYTAMAEVAKGRRGYVGTTELTVTGSNNIDDLSITIPNTVSIAGRIRIDDATKSRAQIPAPDWKGVSISLFRGGTGIGTFEAERHTLAADGSFHIDNVHPARYGIVAAGLPDGFYMKSITAGGVDITDSGNDWSVGNSGPIEILISPTAGHVTGTAQRDPDSADQSGTVVVLIPKEKSRRELARLYQQTTTDSQGRFTFRNLAPGEYKVYAWEDVEPTAWLDPGFMKPLEELGVSATVPESGQVSVQAKVIPAESSQQPK
jgi:hypothetical protein